MQYHWRALKFWCDVMDAASHANNHHAIGDPRVPCTDRILQKETEQLPQPTGSRLLKLNACVLSSSMRAMHACTHALHERIAAARSIVELRRANTFIAIAVVAYGSVATALAWNLTRVSYHLTSRKTHWSAIFRLPWWSS